MAPCRSAPSTPISTSSRSRNECWRAGGSATSSPRPSGCARTPSRGSSTRARRPPTAGPACTTCGPGSSRTSTPASRRCGATTCPARAAGTATGCRSSSRSRRSSGSLNKHEIEAFGVAEFNQRCRDSVQRYVEDWSALTDAIGHLDRHRGRLLDAVQRLHRVGLVAPPPDVGQGPALRGPPGHALLRRAAAPRSSCHELGQPDVYRDVVDPSVVRALPAHRRAARPTPTSSCGPPRRGRSSPTSPPPSAPTSTTCGSRRGAGGATSCSRSGRRPPLRRGRGRGRRPLHRPRAGRVALPAAVHRSSPLDEAAAAGRRRRLRDHRRRHRHRAHSPPPSARTTPTSGAPRAFPCSTRSTPTARSTTRCRHCTGVFVKDADRTHHRRPRGTRAARARAALRAQLPPLLALRHAAHLLGQDVVVRAHLRAARRAAARERDASAGTPSTSSTAASASGSRATSTGRSRATATGARRCPSGAAPTRHDTCIGRRRRAVASSRAATSPTSTSTGPTSTTSRSRVRSTGATRRPAGCSP